ncbi:hypothetical protein D3C87_500650 [compost metagenome]
MTAALTNVGPESEKGVVSALNDLFGPSFREIGEYLADKVRLHRLRSLNKILKRAQDFGPAGVEFLAPPSLKFLLTFTDRASLEESDELCDLWARLLVQASESEQARHIYFADVISKIGPAEAALFDQLITSPRVRRGALSQIEDAGLEYRHWWAERRYQEAMSDAAGDEHIAIFGTIARLECFGGRVIAAFKWSTAEDDTVYEAIPWPEASKDRLSLELLQQLGLIKFEEGVEYAANGGEASFTFAYVTPLGAEFFYSTHDPLYRLIPDERPSGVYPDSQRIQINAASSSYIGSLDPDFVVGA